MDDKHKASVALAYLLSKQWMKITAKMRLIVGSIFHKKRKLISVLYFSPKWLERLVTNITINAFASMHYNNLLAYTYTQMPFTMSLILMKSFSTIKYTILMCKPIKIPGLCVTLVFNPQIKGSSPFQISVPWNCTDNSHSITVFSSKNVK